MPVPRSLPALLAALLLALPGTVAAPSVDGAISGTGTATTFQVFAGPGYALKGGVHQWTYACGDCQVRFAVSASSFTLVQDGVVQTLPPGSYEIRGFSGVLAQSARAPGDFSMWLHGEGRVVRLA